MIKEDWSLGLHNLRTYRKPAIGFTRFCVSQLDAKGTSFQLKDILQFAKDTINALLFPLDYQPFYQSRSV